MQIRTSRAVLEELVVERVRHPPVRTIAPTPEEFGLLAVAPAPADMNHLVDAIHFPIDRSERSSRADPVFTSSSHRSSVLVAGPKMPADAV